MRYYKRIDEKGNITTVESYSHDLDVKGAIEINEQEFNDYLDKLPEPDIEPPRDLASELDNVKSRLDAIEQQIPFTTG